MKNVVLYICILTLCLCSEGYSQVLHGNVVDDVPVSLWNDIVKGWRASEKEVEALQEEHVADSTVIAKQSRELSLSDSTTKAVTVLYKGCTVALYEEKKVSEKYFKIVEKGCPEQRKPWLLNPWTYVTLLGGFVTGVYVESRLR